VLERDGATRLTLGPLDGDAVVDLLTETFGVPPDQDLLVLASGAAGHPWLLTELIHGLREENAVRVAGGQASLISSDLPLRIHVAVQLRLESLSSRARHLLATAAVLGPSFRLEDAAEMLGQTPAALLPTVEEAMGAGIVTAAEDAFSFQHEIVGRAVAEMLPRPAQKALHRPPTTPRAARRRRIHRGLADQDSTRGRGRRARGHGHPRRRHPRW
jgi:predicted ATPase